VWDHLDRERNKRQPTSKEELWDFLQETWRTVLEDYDKKACLRGFRLCWKIKVLMVNSVHILHFHLCVNMFQSITAPTFHLHGYEWEADQDFALYCMLKNWIGNDSTLWGFWCVLGSLSCCRSCCFVRELFLSCFPHVMFPFCSYLLDI